MSESPPADAPIHAIYPYADGKDFFFDIPEKGLTRLPFLAHTYGQVLHDLIPDSLSDFVVLFSAAPMPSSDLELACEVGNAKQPQYRMVRPIAGEPFPCPTVCYFYDAPFPARIFLQVRPRWGL